MKRSGGWIVVPVVVVLSWSAVVSGKTAATPAQKCAAAKVKAMSRKAGALLACYAKALGRGAAVDGTCLAKASSKFTVAFAKIDAKGGCGVTGDTAAVEAQIDADVAALVEAAPVGPTTTSSTRSTTSTTTLPSCAVEGGSCGSCGDGICTRHCPDTTLICVSNGTAVVESCNADGACVIGKYCVSNGPGCGGGGLNGCAAICE